MRIGIILVLCASLIQEIDGREKPHVTCEKDYKKIGCFRQETIEGMEPLFNDRAHNSEYVIDWRNFPASTHSIACRCSEKAKSQGFKYFSIRFWGLCYAGRDLKFFDTAVMDPKARSANCANPKFQVCDDAHKDECVGKAQADYLYLINNEASAEENVDGGLTNWSEWSPCSETCGTDLMQERERTCTNPLPKGTGKGCEGELTEVRSCGLPECPIDGGFTPWNDGDCSVTCGGGVMKQTRTCDNPPPLFGGAKCLGPEIKYKSCGLQVCPVDGGYSNWSKFNDCSEKCGDGVQSRTRKCNNPTPAFGGRTCDRLGYMEESRACKIKECPVDGGYGKWSEFSACSVTCGGGFRRRIRHCDSPAPKHGGKQCIGPKSQTEECNRKACPVDGSYGSWTDFSSCSKSCGGGTQTRTRKCDSPAPARGGKDCSRLGHASDSRTCNQKACPPKWSRQKMQRKCQGEVLNLNCGNGGKIYIDDAMYGRTSKDHCRTSAVRLFYRKPCRANSSFSKVRNRCNGKQHCKIKANVWTFGILFCPYKKYLEVKYKCKGGPYAG